MACPDLVGKVLVDALGTTNCALEFLPFYSASNIRVLTFGVLERMKAIVLILLFVTSAFAQAPAQPQVDLGSILVSIQGEAISTASQIGSLRINKWKTDSDQKQLAQQNADSLVRNLSAALPAIANDARQHPESFAANFKLYRNLSALYDVMLPLTESAGAFGDKSEYQAMGMQLQRWDSIRRSLGDYLEQLAVRKDAQAAAAAPPTKKAAPKKIIVDDTPTPSKKKKKK
jgi:hypothetical protein